MFGNQNGLRAGAQMIKQPGLGAVGHDVRAVVARQPACDALGLAAVQRLEVRLIDARGKDRGAIGGLDHALPGIYTFGLTGVDADGARLKAGAWKLRVRYVPAADPDGAWRAGPESVVRVLAPRRAR